jgi:hypothetical protein
MYARVVRFTEVNPEHVAEVTGQIQDGGGPPPGVPAKSIKMMVDEAQSTAVVVIFFESEEDLRQGSEALDAMDAGETPGTRASVDLCEVKAEMEA